MLSANLEQVKTWLLSRRGSPPDSAVEAVLRAVNETSRYIADSTAIRRRSRADEVALVRLWQQAALELRRTDPALSRRLQMKAEYWADPSSWTEREIARADIYLDDIKRIARQMLAHP